MNNYDPFADLKTLGTIVGPQEGYAKGHAANGDDLWHKAFWRKALSIDAAPSAPPKMQCVSKCRKKLAAIRTFPEPIDAAPTCADCDNPVLSPPLCEDCQDPMCMGDCE